MTDRYDDMIVQIMHETVVKPNGGHLLTWKSRVTWGDRQFIVSNRSHTGTFKDDVSKALVIAHINGVMQTAAVQEMPGPSYITADIARNATLWVCREAIKSATMTYHVDGWPEAAANAAVWLATRVAQVPGADILEAVKIQDSEDGWGSRDWFRWSRDIIRATSSLTSISKRELRDRILAAAIDQTKSGPVGVDDWCTTIAAYCIMCGRVAEQRDSKEQAE